MVVLVQLEYVVIIAGVNGLFVGVEVHPVHFYLHCIVRPGLHIPDLRAGMDDAMLLIEMYPLVEKTFQFAGIRIHTYCIIV